MGQHKTLQLSLLAIMIGVLPNVASAQWTSATLDASWEPRCYHTAVSFNEHLWVIGGGWRFYGWGSSTGSYSDVWKSWNGASWTSVALTAPWGKRAGHSSVVFDGKMWVLGGVRWRQDSLDEYLNDVWFSVDGERWTSATLSAEWPARAFHSSVVYDGKIWVLGGATDRSRLNDVWYSSDGATWTSATLSAQWPARYGHSSVIHNGMMWVIGGHKGEIPYFYQDVWKSSNGASWTAATLAAPWSARGGHSSLSYMNRIWIFGGQDISASSLRDVWNSSDGISWSRFSESAEWWPRVGHASAVHASRMWILGGEYPVIDGAFYFNSVWFSRPPAAARLWEPY